MRTSIIALLSAATLAVPAAVLADGSPSQPNQPPGTPPPAIAALLCKVEAARSGTDASGSNDSLAACVKQELPTVRAALASCKSAGSRDEMKECVAKAFGLPAPNELPGAGGDQQTGQGGPGGQSGPGQGHGNGKGRPGGQQQNRR